MFAKFLLEACQCAMYNSEKCTEQDIFSQPTSFYLYKSKNTWKWWLFIVNVNAIRVTVRTAKSAPKPVPGP